MGLDYFAGQYNASIAGSRTSGLPLLLDADLQRFTCCRYELGYRAEFLWQGTSDFTAWLAAPACLAVQRALTPAAITTYNHHLAKEATNMLLEAWGTQLAVGIAPDGTTAGLVAIQLPWPLHINDSSAGGEAERSLVAVNRVTSSQDPEAGSPGRRGPTPADAAALNLLLRERYSIEVPVACVSGVLFTRISAQIYNSMQDYERLRDVVLQLRQGAL